MVKVMLALLVLAVESTVVARGYPLVADYEGDISRQGWKLKAEEAGNWFKRDSAHNDDRGKQLIARTMASYFRMAAGLPYATPEAQGVSSRAGSSSVGSRTGVSRSPPTSKGHRRSSKAAMRGLNMKGVLGPEGAFEVKREETGR